MYQSALYEDKLIRVRVDVEDLPTNWEFFRSYKDVLKQRFEQEDIWITAYRIELPVECTANGDARLLKPRVVCFYQVDPGVLKGGYDDESCYTVLVRRDGK